MLKTAIMWIRDGVLIERMHINAVAFAYAVQLSSNPWSAGLQTGLGRLSPDRLSATTDHKTDLLKLIYYAFDKSGLSCAEKVALYNSERQTVVTDVESTVQLYNAIATEAAKDARYFDGTIELLRDLKSGGSANFITSALEQELLDSWFAAPQGQQIAASLEAVLGKRGDFTKGRAHFHHISELGYERIYYVADAVFEISTSAKLAHEFNLIPIGFGNEITKDTVFEAVGIVSAAVRRLGRELRLSGRDDSRIDGLTTDLDAWKSMLVDPQTDPKLLADAGAKILIEGAKSTLMHHLRQYFESQHLLEVD